MSSVSDIGRLVN